MNANIKKKTQKEKFESQNYGSIWISFHNWMIFGAFIDPHTHCTLLSYYNFNRNSSKRKKLSEKYKRKRRMMMRQNGLKYFSSKCENNCDPNVHPDEIFFFLKSFIDKNEDINNFIEFKKQKTIYHNSISIVTF